MKLSVIIPVYNAAGTVEAAVRSIALAPPPFDYEILLINDGSEDESETVLKRLAEAFPAVRTVTQENQGPAAARNRGIKEARGEYVVFCDSDDTFSENALEEAVKGAEETAADLFLFGFFWVKRGNEIPYGHPDAVMDGDEEKGRLLASLYRTNMLNQVWGKVFRRALLLEEEILFPHRIWGEDRLFLFSVLEKAKKVAVTEKALYRYVQQEESLISRFSEEKAATCSEIHRRVIAMATSFGATDGESLSVFSYMYQKSLISVLFTLESVTCPFGFLEKYRYAKGLLSAKELEKLPPVPKDTGLAFSLLSLLFRIKSPFLALLAAKAMKFFNRFAPELFRKAKHVYNKGETK